MQNWKVIDEDYLDFLRGKENRIPNSNYGEFSMKPFFGSLFEIDKLSYVTQITSPKQRHITMTEKMDFIKVYHPKDPAKLITVINLNYMFPVPTSLLEDLQYRDIDHYRKFDDEYRKSQYIRFLRLQLQEINKLIIEDQAKKVYDQKYLYPDSDIACRSFDFKFLEQEALKWPISN